MATLRLQGIEKTFQGGHEAVAGVDLEVAEHEMVVLLGPSGCGKSTLLRIVAGVESPTQGRVFIADEDVTDLPPQKRDVAMVFQSYALYPHMSVRDNLGFGLRMRGGSRDEISERVAEVVEILEITALLDRRPSQLSGGQRQRVALGRAIARRAKVFLLDEPLSNLDVQLRLNTRTELSRLHHRLNAPMLYVTHDQEEAITLGDRVVVMRDGRVLQVGTPLEIYARPATRFVGGFVGSPRMNFLRGVLETSGGRPTRVEAQSVDLTLDLRPESTQAAVSDRDQGTGKREVIIGFRPEDIRLVEPGNGDLDARVDVIEPLGREDLLHLVAKGEQDQQPDGLRVLADPASGVTVGSLVGLSLKREKVHLFDPESEARVA
jgi:multiple sugar transport system ATP-binding protein